MLLNGHLLSEFKTCSRRFFLQQQYRYLPYYPNTLFAACMRKAIFALSSGKDKHATTTSAINNFISNVKFPGLDLPSSVHPYTLAMDYSATIRNIIEYLSRLPLLTIRLIPNIPVPGLEGVSWQFLSVEDESGLLHRWKFVDSINDNTILKELHSWEVFGDLVLGHAPMTLHLINIGRREGSHRISPWCRAYKSPAINTYKFQKKLGGNLGEGWKPIYFADNIDNDPEIWVDLMESDNCLDSTLIRHVGVREPQEIHATNFLVDLSTIVKEIALYCPTIDEGESGGGSKVDPFTLPLTRSACDTPYICPHQPVCYSIDPTAEIKRCGNYERTNADAPRGRGRPPYSEARLLQQPLPPVLSDTPSLTTV